MKLSERARQILAVIDKATQWEGDERPGHVLIRFYCPRINDGVSGAGDAAVIRALARAWLIKLKPELSPYAASITEDGILALFDTASAVCGALPNTTRGVRQ